MPCETRPPHVVLVDDDLTFVETFGALLRHEGYSVEIARTASDARDCLERQTPDVLITDIRLGSPSHNGWQLAKYARTHQPGVHVVVVTGCADHLEAEAEYWSVPVFLKPFDPIGLIDHLRNH
ncbi:MAG: response regulator [Chloroflexota bacterium]|nr:response regulator [Chloroflexota bacterium]